MSPIKDLQLIYESLNEEDTFSEGDTLKGVVTFTLTKEIKVKSIFVKFKGDAKVHWTEGSGDHKKTYSDHKRYFKLKEHLVAEDTKGAVLHQGLHSYEFSFQIPEEEMPSSFKGHNGQIVYMLEVKLSRSWRWPSEIQKELKFVSKFFSNPGLVMCPSSGSVDKEVGVLSKGQVQMSATIDRKVYAPGDTLSVVAKISNYSSKTMKPKFSLHQKIVYSAHGASTTTDENLCKMVGDIIPVNSEETVSCQIKIPDDVIHTLNNCEIISVEYYVKVYLDISFAFDPEVVLPLVVVPFYFANLRPGEAMGPYPAGTIGAPSYSDFPPPAVPIGPYPVPAGPDVYGYPPPDPSQQANIPSGYNNLYDFQAAAFPPPLLEHADPTAPPQFPQ